MTLFMNRGKQYIEKHLISNGKMNTGSFKPAPSKASPSSGLQVQVLPIM